MYYKYTVDYPVSEWILRVNDGIFCPRNNMTRGRPAFYRRILDVVNLAQYTNEDFQFSYIFSYHYANCYSLYI